jgi:hypothetical protein
MSSPEFLTIKCKHCGKKNLFDQPYPYHAGFADQGFLYNDAGTLTLVWSITDPLFAVLFPGETIWTLSLLNRRRLEKLLLPAPQGVAGGSATRRAACNVPDRSRARCYARSITLFIPAASTPTGRERAGCGTI